MPASPPHANAADSRAAAPPRVPLLPVLLVLTVSVSLHVVPQWLKAWIDPAWTMAALMLLDALIIAVLVRSQGALRTVALLAGLLALVVLTRQQSFVALPSGPSPMMRKSRTLETMTRRYAPKYLLT